MYSNVAQMRRRTKPRSQKHDTEKGFGFGGFVKGPKHPSKTKVVAEKMIFYPKRLHCWFLKIAPQELPKQETVQKPKKRQSSKHNQ